MNYLDFACLNLYQRLTTGLFLFKILSKQYVNLIKIYVIILQELLKVLKSLNYLIVLSILFYINLSNRAI